MEDLYANQMCGTILMVDCIIVDCWLCAMLSIKQSCEQFSLAVILLGD